MGHPALLQSEQGYTSSLEEPLSSNELLSPKELPSSEESLKELSSSVSLEAKSFVSVLSVVSAKFWWLLRSPPVSRLASLEGL